MLISSHQPDLIAWSGLFHKMWRADLFDIAIWDAFNSRGYHRRVTMRDRWATLPVKKCPLGTPIAEVELTEVGNRPVWDAIVGRYRDARYWPERAEMVRGWLEEADKSRLLWQHNLSLILSVKEYLGIKTPIAIGSPLACRGIEGVLEMCDQYRHLHEPLTYLSGGGGRGYLGEDPEAAFSQSGYRLAWSNHSAECGDSILTAIFDHADPLAVVRRAA